MNKVSTPARWMTTIQDHLEQMRHRSGRVWRLVQRRIHTRSLLTLQLFGFCVVALPLIIGLIVSSQQISRVTRDSEALLERAISAGQIARGINDRVIAYERAARQYRVLEDTEARASLEQRHQALTERLSQFAATSQRTQLTDVAAELADHNDRLLRAVLQTPTGTEWPASLAEGFEELQALTAELVGESEAAARRDLERLESRGAAARTSSLVGLAITVLLAIVLAVVLANRINRPIRQLDRAMRSLARPETGPVEQITSPRDLRALSVRLEWVRRRLARIERDRQRLVGQVSHELKTPLSAIREGVSLLTDQSFGPLGERQLEVADIIETNIARLQVQIENLLRFNRVQAGPEPDFHNQVDLLGLIDRVLTDHRFALESAGIRIERWLDEEVRIDADPDMLITIIDNLVSNAIKFSPPKATIGISAHQWADHVLVSVADQGPGVRPADRRRLFEPFFRGDHPAIRSKGGSGLGLAICHDLVRAHRGEIRIRDQKGWSSVFEIKLPKHREENGSW